MRRQGRWQAVGAGAMMLAGSVHAAEPARVREAMSPRQAAPTLRLKVPVDRSDPRLRVDDPRSQLRTGYGGTMVDLFPFEGGKFHLSAGPRLFGRAGRPRSIEPESLHYLPTFRPAGLGGMRRRGGAAMLMGYGRTVDTGLALGIDTGVVMGRVMPPPPGARRMMRLQGTDGAVNEVARATMLYRF